MKIKRIINTVASLSILASCGKVSEDAAALKSEVRVSPDLGAAVLGMGYNSQKESFTQSCIELAEGKEIKYGGTQIGNLGFEHIRNFESLETKLDVHVAGKLSLPVYQVSGAANFLREALGTELSESVMLVYQVNGKTALLDDTQLRKETEKKIKGKGIQQVIESCGDRYISGVSLGGKLFVNIRFDFLNEAAKSSFKGKIKASYKSVLEIEGSAEVWTKQLNDRVHITISAYQMGGDPSLLANIFKGEESNTNQNGFGVINCSIAKPDECKKALKAILSYLDGDKETSFANQLKNMTYDPTKPNGPAALSYTTRSYLEGGYRDLFPDENPALAEETVNRRKDIIDQMRSNWRHKRQANILLESRLAPDERKIITEISKTIQANIDALNSAAKVCWDKPLECSEKGKYTLKEYDPALLIKRLSFYDYCEIQSLEQDARNTVEAVRKFYKYDDTTSCQTLEKNVLREETLDFTDINLGFKIKDLTPLQDLQNLTVLKIPAHDVISIEPLLKLENLEILDLSSNNIGTIKGIENLKKLRKLDLSLNRLNRVDALKKTTGLTHLSLIGNPFEKKPEVKDFNNIKHVIFDEGPLCESERLYLLQNKVITKGEYKAYKEDDLAPLYKTYNDRKSGVSSWLNCASVFQNFLGDFWNQ